MSWYNLFFSNLDFINTWCKRPSEKQIYIVYMTKEKIVKIFFLLKILIFCYFYPVIKMQ